MYTHVDVDADEAIGDGCIWCRLYGDLSITAPYNSNHKH